MKISIQTLGCKVNQYDSQEISENLIRHGHTIVSENADAYIVNSCTVTAESDRKTRQLVRKIKRNNPGSIVLLTGCMPQAFPNLGEELLEADIVIGNRSNSQIPTLLENYSSRYFAVSPHLRTDSYTGGIVQNFDGHTRAFVKIQDGCDRFCSYCAIPYARGRSRSKPFELIAQELRGIAENGYKEVVFVGINLSAYGMDIPDEKLNLASVVELAQNTEGIERIRLGSLEPDHITQKMLSDLRKNSKFCPQFHISLQSGCDKILKKMNRHYTAEQYAELCENIRNTFPDATITTDIICGFPGENEEDFAETIAFAEKIKLDKTHIFPYSRRPGTPADKLPSQVENAIKDSRCARLNEVCENSRREFMENMIGQTVDVLFEAPDEDVQKGYTKNYIPVFVKTNKNLIGKIEKVVIKSYNNDTLMGELHHVDEKISQ